MKKQELIMLKRLLRMEVTKRNRINELLEKDLIKEFITLNNLNIQTLEVNDSWSIISEILKSFEITETNGILVCVGNYAVDYNICYEETNYYTINAPFDDPRSEFRVYEDIESGKRKRGYIDSYIQRKIEEEKRWYGGDYSKSLGEYCNAHGYALTSDIEKKYTVLLPKDSRGENISLEEIRKDFFVNAIEKGQTKAKQLVLKKYQRIN